MNTRHASTLLRATLCIGVGMCGSAALAQAQVTRLVVINGLRVDDVTLGQLDRAACSRVPDGHYWLNPHTGQWGYAGEPWVRGYIGDACRPAAPPQPSLSERGRLYRPGEILNGR